MSIELNKQIAQRFIESIGTLDAALVGSQMCEQSMFYTMFRSSGHPLVSEQTGASYCHQMGTYSRKSFPNGFEMHVLGMIAEGDRVAVEAEGIADLGGGRSYRNLYHFHLTIADDKIKAVKEYTDFLHVVQAFPTEDLVY